MSYRRPFPKRKIDLVRESLVGKQLIAVPAPAVIIDRSIVQRNCSHLLDACRFCELKFRPHIKTHKTEEVTHLQLGDQAQDLNIVVSTLAEAEFITEYLLKRKQGKGVTRSANILYGIPLPPSQIERLAKLGQRLGPRSISVMIDHVTQIPPLSHFHKVTNWRIDVFIKVDTGYHRAGVQATPDDNEAFCEILRSLLSIEYRDTARLSGLYSHAGHSYHHSSTPRCMELLVEEMEGLIGTARLVASVADELRQDCKGWDLTLSVGATPTVNTIQHHAKTAEHRDGLQLTIDALKHELTNILPKASLEVHAGCYPFLDIQQLATKAGPSHTSRFFNAFSDVGLTVLAEVNSLYDDRKPPEAMIAAGTLAIGREPCQSYGGWGIVSTWGFGGTEVVDGYSGWIVGRISQEHGMLEHLVEVPGMTKKVPSPMSLLVGQKVRVLPNHACIAGAGFDYYVVVDSSLPVGRRNEVVDVWARCNGW